MKNISIIIIVKNDRLIEDTLSSLKRINKPLETEIVVVDASKRKVLLDIRKKFPEVRWLYYKNTIPKKITIPEQINFGVSKSKGDILVFFDSAGCTVTKDWLINLTGPLIKKEELFVSGSILAKGKSHHHIRKNSKYIFLCGSANSAMVRNVFFKVGKRDTKFEYGSDLDFSMRAIDAGYKIRYVPTALMYHDWGDFKQDIKRAYRYGVARTRLYKKHRKKLSTLILYIGFFLYIVILPLTFVIFPLFISLLLVYFILNINKRPLRKLAFDFFYGFGSLKELILPKAYK